VPFVWVWHTKIGGKTRILSLYIPNFKQKKIRAQKRLQDILKVCPKAGLDKTGQPHQFQPVLYYFELIVPKPVQPSL